MEDEYVLFLPKPLEAAFACVHAEGLAAQRYIVEIHGFKFPGLIISGPVENLKKFEEHATTQGYSPRDHMFGMLKDLESTTPLPHEKLMFAGETVVGTTYCRVLAAEGLVSHLPEYGWDIRKHEQVLGEITSVLTDLSAWAGRQVVLCSPNDVMVGLPVVEDQEEIYIILNTSPAGDRSVITSTELCGVDLGEFDAGIKHPGPTKGRGFLVKDQKGNVVAQIINNQFYIFLPFDVMHKRMILSNNGLGLFRKMLTLAWNAQFEAHEEPKQQLVASVDDYTAFVKEAAQEAPDTLRSTLSLLDFKIREAEEKLRRAINDKRSMMIAIRVAEEDAGELSIEKIWDEWSKLCSLPQIRSVAVVEGGLQVETNLLVNTQYGRRPLGRYIIRISYSEVFLWCVESCHPTGFPHPHIGKHGAPCFGNVSSAIQKAVGVSRVHVIELVLRWLENGYDEDLADTKITEWPEVA